MRGLLPRSFRPQQITARLPIFLMHVPKCAGTSVYLYLRELFDESEICPSPRHGVWSWEPHNVPGYKLYSGHFSVEFLGGIHEQGTRLIVMRDPLSRVVSLYDFWRSYRWEYIRTALPPLPNNGPAVAKSGDLSAFLNTDSKFVQEQIYNPMARQLLGKAYRVLWPDQEALTEAAVNSLHQFDWIGTAESFEICLRMLGRLLGLSVPTAIPKELRTYGVPMDDRVREPVGKSRPSREEYLQILRGNRIDAAIYAEGRKIVGARAQAM